jgi:hypothetical protein
VAEQKRPLKAQKRRRGRRGLLLERKESRQWEVGNLILVSTFPTMAENAEKYIASRRHELGDKTSGQHKLALAAQ